MDDYEYLKARHDILLSVVKHYANIQNWRGEGGKHWTPQRVYKYENGEKKPSGYDAGHKALNVLGEMEKKRKELTGFCEKEKKRYVNSTKKLFPDSDIKD